MQIKSARGRDGALHDVAVQRRKEAASRQAEQVEDEKPGFEFGLLEKVNLHLNLQVQQGNATFWAGTSTGRLLFDSNLSALLQDLGVPSSHMASLLSPARPITVAPELRYRFSIPADADSMSFVYPLSEIEVRSNQSSRPGPKNNCFCFYALCRVRSNGTD